MVNEDEREDWITVRAFGGDTITIFKFPADEPPDMWATTRKEWEEHEREVIRETRRAILRRINFDLDQLARDGAVVSWSWIEGVTAVAQMIDPEHERERLL